MDNGTGYDRVTLGMATAKAQLDEAQTRLRFTERMCAERATEALKANLVVRQTGRDNDWRGKDYHIARATLESQQNRLTLALELLASAHRACSEAHEAMRKAVEADVRYHGEP